MLHCFHGVDDFQIFYDSEIENSFSMCYLPTSTKFIFEKCMESSNVSSVEKRIEKMIDGNPAMNDFVNLCKDSMGSTVISAFFCLNRLLFQKYSNNGLSDNL